MVGIKAWNMFSIVFSLCFVYGFNYCGVNAINSKSESDLYDSFEHPQIWSTLLEQMTINDSLYYHREGRAYNQQYPYKYIPTSNVYITKRIGNVAPLGPAAFKQNINFNGNGGNPGGPNNNNNNHYFNNNRFPTNTPEVSETDLYLLNAIEKLVYRVDYMERRLQKTEQIVYYLMAGNNQNQKEMQDKIEKPEKPCALNFTRVGDTCYLFIANKPSNWKTANNVCRSYGAHLAELETLAKNDEVVSYLLNHQQTLNGDFWLGGLNPGLLWIWSTSARPVNPNVNLTQISNSTTTHSTGSTFKISPKIYNNKPITITKVSNETATIIEKKPNDKKEKIIVNKKEEIKIEGNGRCLGLAQKIKQNKPAYEMYGFDCTSRQRIICELAHDDIENEIDRISKKLFS